MKKSSLLVVALLVVINIGILVAFPNQISVKGFISSVYSIVSGVDKQEANAQASTGTLTISVSYGSVYKGNQGNYFTSERALTSNEISQTSLKIYSYVPPYTQTVYKTGVKPGDVLTVPAGNYFVSADSVPSGDAFTTLGAFGSPANCVAPSVGAGKNTTCTAGIYDGTIKNSVSNPFDGVPPGAANNVSRPDSSMASAVFQKILVDNSANKYGTLLDSRIVKFGSKNYLLVGANMGFAVVNNIQGTAYRIYVFDISQPLSPVQVSSLDVNTGGNQFLLSDWSVADNYPYVIAFNKLFSLNSSGQLAYIRDFPNIGCTVGMAACASTTDIATPMLLFREGSKTYLAAYARDYETSYGSADPVANGQGYISRVNNAGTPYDDTKYTNAVIFFDVTNGINQPLAKTGILSGFRVVRQLTSDLAEQIRWPYYGNFGHEPFSVTTGGKTYFGMEWYREVHRLHSGVGHYSLIDVTSISSPQIVVEAGLSSEISKIFSHDRGLNDTEKVYLNYEGDYSTLIDSASVSAVHWFRNYVASLGLFAPVFDATIVSRNLSQVRLDNVIMGEKFSGGGSIFSEMPNTRSVLCEQRGGTETDYRFCGTGKTRFPFTDSGFGSPVGYKSGVVISSTGFTGVVGSGGFGLSDTSAQLLAPIAVAPVNTYMPKPALQTAALYQIDSKNFAVYVVSGSKMGVAKLTVSSTISTTGGGATSGTGSTGGGMGVINALGTTNTTPFSINSLLNIVKKFFNNQ